MFKIHLKAKFTREDILAMSGDIIVCSLPEGDKREFYVKSITSNGVIIGTFTDNINPTIAWPYGENYNRICAVVEH